MDILRKIKQFNVLKGTIHTMTILLGISGLSSHYYNHSQDRYYPSRPMLMYAVTVTVVFSMVYLKDIYDYLAQNKLDVSNVAKLYSYLNVAASIISYVRGLMLERKMVEFMNRIQLLDMIDFFEMSADYVRRPVLLTMLRALLFPLIIELMFMLRQMRNEPDRPLLWTLYTLVPTVVSQIMPNCVYGVLVLWKLLIGALNMRLQRICNEVNRLQMAKEMQLEKPYYRMKRFCDLADTLDLLNERYTITCRNCIEYLQLLAVPFVCSLVSNLLALIVGFYMQYHAIADTLINGTNFDVFNAGTNCILLIISLSEIIFLSDLCNNNLLLVRDTGLILQSIHLQYADVRFKQSVEAFSLIAYTNNFKIKPLGLLEVNSSMVKNVFHAVTSFLLILIQSDLALRFAMK